MILTCPDCGTRYESDPGRHRKSEENLRCRRCGVSISLDAGDMHAAGPYVVVASEPGSFRNLLCGILKKQGCRVKATADGEQALEWVRKIRPRALFANVFLRRMLGITVSERVHGDPQLTSTRIALIGHPLKREAGAPAPNGLFGASGYIEEEQASRPLWLQIAEFLDLQSGETDQGQGPPAADEAGEEPPGPAAADSPPGAVIAAAGGRPEETAGKAFEIDLDAPAAEEGKEPADEPIDPEAEEEIRRLGRIAADDLCLYYPTEVAIAIESDHVEETFRHDIEQGRRMVEERFPGVPSAVRIFLDSLREKLRRAALPVRS